MGRQKRNFGSVLVELLLFPLYALPLGFHRVWARLVVWVLRDVMRYRRDVIVTNLSRSFPELKYKHIAALTRKIYAHFGDILAEAVWFGGRRGERGRRRLNASGMVDIVNPGEFNELFVNSGSVMVLCAHMGNWEVTTGMFSYNHDAEVPLVAGNSELCVVYRRLKSRTWDRVFADNRLNCLEGTEFHGYLESGEVLRFALTNRSEKHVYVFVTDQYPYRGAAKHPVGTFMNQDTLSMNGGAALACKLKMGVCYLSMKSTGRGKYSMEFVPLCTDASQTTPDEIMKRYYALLEKDIREQPEMYLWTHKRWK